MSEDHAPDAPKADASPRDDRALWGRVRFGERRVSALWAAVPIGLVLALAAAAVAYSTDSAGPHPLFGAAAITAIAIWPCTALAWALLVDRDTLRGASKEPEQSIESFWYERAASRAFTDILLITGLGTAIVAFTGVEISALFALAAVILIAMSSFGIRYLIQRRQG